MQVRDDLDRDGSCADDGHKPVYYSEYAPVKSCDCGAVTESLNGVELAKWWMRIFYAKK